MPQINLHINNQQPIDFSKLSLPIPNDLSKSFDESIQTVVQSLSRQFYQPLQPNQPAQIQLNNQDYSLNQFDTDLTTALTKLDDQPTLDNQFSALFHQVSLYKTNQIQSYLTSFADSFLLSNHAPLPSIKAMYTYDKDIQNQAKALLVDPTNSDKLLQLKLGLIGTLLPKALCRSWLFIITTGDQFDQFKQQINLLLTATNDPNLTTFNNDLSTIDIDPTDSFTSLTIGQQSPAMPYILSTIANLFPSQILPLNLKTFIHPVGISFIDLQNLANTTSQDFKHELSQLSQLTNRINKFRLVKFSQLQTAKKITQQSNSLSNQKQYVKQTPDDIQRQLQRGFHTTMPSVNYQLKRLVKIVNHSTTSLMSDNTYHSSYRTFMRPNRRYPDDINLRGTLQTTSYRPDIHIFLDTSGSISESQYRTAVTMLILISKKLNTNLYFTSFSDEITPTVKLQTKNVSPSLIYRQIKAIPKIDGGTEYENVWRTIDLIDRQSRAAHQAARLNFMITDFAYDLSSLWSPQLHSPSTTRLFYLPMAANQRDYQNCLNWGKDFANELFDRGDHTIYSRILL